MSDFLKNFTDDKYGNLLDEHEEKSKKDDKGKKKEKDSDETTEIPVSKPEPKKSVEKPLSNENTTKEKKKFQPEMPKVLAGKRKRTDTVEEINKDPNYQKKKIIQHGLLVLAILLVFGGGFLGYRMMNERTLPNFVDKPISEMQEWSKKNGVDLDISTEFSMEYSSDHVISVNKKAGSSIQKGDLLIVKVSEGADPEESLEIPDFSTYNESKINDWISENRADNLKVQKEYSTTVKKGDFIRLEFADKDMTRETYKRKDYATVTVSKGEEKKEKTIEVPDFSGEDVSKVTEWATKNEVKIVQNDEYSGTIEMGKVISQSVAAKEKVAKGDELTIAVSKGKAQIVPNFSAYNLHTINETGATENIPYLVVERYSSGVPYGQFISQDVAPGVIIEDGNVENVVVTYSIGKPYINRSDVIYKTEKDIRDYFYEINQKGASITYTIQQVAPSTCQFKDQPIEKGMTCGASYNNQFIEIGGSITIYMANADLVMDSGE